jgi:hypothetical protein
MSTLVYIYSDPVTREPFYVGIGSEKRPKSHWRRVLRGEVHPNPLMHAKLVSLREVGTEPSIEVIARYEDRECAQILEIWAIQFFGQKTDGTGSLCNVNPGSDGIHPDILRKLWREKEYREKVTSAVFAANASSPARAKYMEYLRSDEYAALQAARSTAAMSDPKMRERIARSVAARWEDPAYRSGVTENLRKRWATDPSLKQRVHTPESRLKRSEAIKKIWAERKATGAMPEITEETRRKCSEASKKRWAKARHPAQIST